MTLKLYDTYTRAIRDFKSIEPFYVGMYTCGPTVYDYAHIGNLRTYIFEDLLRRILEFNGYKVMHVMNITDVGHLTSDADTGEDKMEKGSRRTGKSAWEIAEYFTQAFQDDLMKLHIKEPTIWCKATDHIHDQIDFIRCIETKGFTYKTQDGIYFDTSKLPDYGHLARLDVEGLQAGARVDIGEKLNPTDFALWKFCPADHKRQMEWDSPWGIGFPGWAIECSTMSAKYLGTFFDIHCGGEDHIPVHHTNEIAQTQACFGTNLANFWLHGYFLQFDEAKMSKSTGGFLRLQTIIDNHYDPLAYRFFCLNAIYRTKLNFTWESLDSSAKSLDKLRNIVYGWGESGEIDEEFLNKFTDDINDDLNMPRAIADIWELVKSDISPASKKATIIECDRVLGLNLASWIPKEDIIPETIKLLVENRQNARIEKRWNDADMIREKIRSLGYEIEDTSQGPRVKPIIR
jgi:cysteinyl-tRNA synthetase